MKVAFGTVCILYLFFALIGPVQYQYVDVQSIQKVDNAFLWPIIVVSIVTGVLLLLFFKKAFPKGYQQQNLIGKFALWLIFAAVSFQLNRGLVRGYNLLGTREITTLNGIIKEKYIKKVSRRNRNYFLVIKDTSSHTEVTLKVTRNIYDRSQDIGKNFSKQFQIGLLNILYRKEE